MTKALMSIVPAPTRAPTRPLPHASIALPPIAVTLGAAALIQWMLWPLVGPDMAELSLPWRDHGGVVGPAALFAAVAGSMAAIKALALLGTAALALSVRRLLVRLGVEQVDRATVLVFALPSVAADAGLLGQCDAMGTAPLVMALVAALERRHGAMLAWCGLALGLQAQAMLVAPFFLALLINRRVPFRLWPVAPAAFAATMLPAWAAGWPAADLATIHLRQADTFPDLSLNAPNVWSIVQAVPLGVPMIGLAIAAAVGATAAYIAYFSARPLGNRGLVAAALLCVLVTAGLLPGIHERYFFLADILALVLALAIGDRAHWRIAMLVQAGSTLALLGYLIGIDALAMLGAVCMIPATVQLARPLLKPAANDNPLLARAA